MVSITIQRLRTISVNLIMLQYESATIQNTRQKAEVSVVKKDSDTANPLDGGKYTLYAGNDIKNYT